MLIRVLLDLGQARLEKRLRRVLADRSAIVSSLERGASLLEHLERRGVDLVLARVERLAQPWPETCARLRELPEGTELVVLVADEDPHARAALLAAGALAVINSGLDDAALSETLRAVLRRRREQAQGRIDSGRAVRASLDDFVSTSAIMVEFLDVARRVVPGDSSVLILGETGVGKERLARSIHAEGPRGTAQFLAVNCSALPESLLESELFGHEEGAFTGATRSRRGLFELAHRGTIFLDEVGDMPLSLQAKLLRVLQEREFLPVGAEQPVRVDVRVMAATNRDLAAEVAAGRFRADLYYRLCVVGLTVPPLRERREDVPLLARSYADHFRAKLGRGASELSPEALERLTAYDWPGNVRELINVIERAVLLGRGARIEVADLPPAIAAPARATPRGGAARAAAEVGREELGLAWSAARERALRAFERRYFERLLADCEGRVGEAARRAELDPRSLYDKLRRLGLRREDYLAPRAQGAATPPGAGARRAAGTGS
jgi:two-component system response regulator AtoC